MSLGIEAILAAGYGVVLLAVAYGIDAMARRASVHVEQSAQGPFRYHEDHDAWLCPEDQWLWPTSFDPDNRVMRYRASPTVCNACPVKESCTPAHSGREVVRAVDPWPASEAARFHRGIACAVAVLGTLWPLASAVSALASQRLVDAAALLGVVAVLLFVSLPLWSHLRRSPAGYPGGGPGGQVAVRSLDDDVEARRVVSATARRRRARYASDLRGGADGNGS